MKPSSQHLKNITIFEKYYNSPPPPKKKKKILELSSYIHEEDISVNRTV